MARWERDKEGEWHLVDEMRERQLSPHKSNSKLHEALRVGDWATARRLLESQEASTGDRDEHGRVPMHIEMMRGGRNSMKPGNRGDNPLMVACLVDNLEGATYLADTELGHELIPDLSYINSRSNSDGASPLMRAIEGKSMEVAEMLMDK